MHVLPGLLSLILFSGWEREAWEQGVKEEANFLIVGFVLLWRINVRLWSIAELLIVTISLQKLKLIESVMWSTAIWIGCDCGRWFHIFCVGLEEVDESFMCDFCQPEY